MTKRAPWALARLSAVVLLAAGHPGGTVVLAEELQYNRVYLEAQAERKVPNDQLTAVLAVERQSLDPAELAKQVNRDMEWALVRTREQDGMQARHLAYHTQPVYEDRRLVAWRARQELELQSTDVPALTALLGALQERLQVAQLSFAPTPATRRSAEDALIEEALAAFKARAGLVGRQFDGARWRIIDLHITTAGGAPPMPFAMQAQARGFQAETAPSVEAGTSTVTVTVTGSVQYDAR